MQNIVRWRSNQFQPTHIWNPWSNKTDANLEDSACTVHCKYIRPDYDGTLAIHRSGTIIPCRDQLQCKIWEFPIQNSITQDQQEGQNTISKMVKITI